MKLADMQGLGPCARKGLWVRVPPPALIVRIKFFNSNKDVTVAKGRGKKLPRNFRRFVLAQQLLVVRQCHRGMSPEEKEKIEARVKKEFNRRI